MLQKSVTDTKLLGRYWQTQAEHGNSVSVTNFAGVLMQGDFRLNQSPARPQLSAGVPPHTARASKPEEPPS
jgi:hypothetical protein